MKLCKYLLLSLLITFFSCKKKNLEFNFKGKVVAKYNGQPVSNALVKIKGNALGSALNTVSESTKTNSSGEFEIALERSKIEKVIIVVEKDNYFTEEKEYQFDDLTTSDDNIINFKINPKSWTRFEVRNLSYPDPNDVFKLQKVGGKTGCEECCDNGEYTFLYGDFDTSIYCINNGGTYMRFYHWFNDNEVFGLDSIYNEPFDTVTFSLVY